jgi:hypothetical protein
MTFPYEKPVEPEAVQNKQPTTEFSSVCKSPEGYVAVTQAYNRTDKKESGDTLQKDKGWGNINW